MCCFLLKIIFYFFRQFQWWRIWQQSNHWFTTQDICVICSLITQRSFYCAVTLKHSPVPRMNWHTLLISFTQGPNSSVVLCNLNHSNSKVVNAFYYYLCFALSLNLSHKMTREINQAIVCGYVLPRTVSFKMGGQLLHSNSEMCCNGIFRGNLHVVKNLICKVAVYLNDWWFWIMTSQNEDIQAQTNKTCKRINSLVCSLIVRETESKMQSSFG